MLERAEKPSEEHLDGNGTVEGGPLRRLADTEGEVKWFDPRKGFGFIVGPEGQDIFAHFSAIVGDGFRVLRDGSRVKYDAEETSKGWKATRVERLEQEVIVPSRARARTSRR